MKYAYREDIFEAIQWTGDNFEEVEDFVNTAADNQSVSLSEGRLILHKRGNETYVIPAGFYLRKDIEYGECMVEDSSLMQFVTQVEVKE